MPQISRCSICLLNKGRSGWNTAFAFGECHRKFYTLAWKPSELQFTLMQRQYSRSLLVEARLWLTSCSLFSNFKAREVHRTTGGSQQVLPLDSIYRKNLPDSGRPLPHMKRGVSVSRVRGNPVFARELLHYTKDPDNCKVGA